MLIQDINESSLNQLLKIQAEVFKKYCLGRVPDGLFIDVDSKKYSFECDKIIINTSDQGFYNFGGVEQANRFMTFMFIVNNDLSETKLNFPLQKVTNICKLGDLYVLPANFPHRFKVELAENETFTAVSLHLCFVIGN
jgi:hypothetical protein|tara:strand:- start:30790 stop:31203 length:414 start_codon:yes stop_codon:yes gene_type:complete